MLFSGLEALVPLLSLQFSISRINLCVKAYAFLFYEPRKEIFVNRGNPSLIFSEASSLNISMMDNVGFEYEFKVQ